MDISLTELLGYLTKFAALVKTPDFCLLFSLVIMGTILQHTKKFTNNNNIPFVVLAFGAEGGAIFFAPDHATGKVLLQAAWQGFCYGGLAIGIYEVGLKYLVKALRKKFPFLNVDEESNPNENSKPTP